MAEIIFSEGDAPGTPSTGKVTLYAKTDGLLYFKDDGGSEHGFGGGITSLNALIAAAQLFDKVNDTNVTLTITSSGDTHTFTLGWTGTLALSRLVPASAPSILLGRQNGSSGDFQEITLGTNLSMAGTTLNASGSGGGVSEELAIAYAIALG